MVITCMSRTGWIRFSWVLLIERMLDESRVSYTVLDNDQNNPLLFQHPTKMAKPCCLFQWASHKENEIQGGRGISNNGLKIFNDCTFLSFCVVAMSSLVHFNTITQELVRSMSRNILLRIVNRLYLALRAQR